MNDLVISSSKVIKSFKGKATKIFVKIILLLLLIGLAYIIIYPFLFRILSAFMSTEDLYDPMVSIVPAHWTFSRFAEVLNNQEFLSSMLKTALYAIGVAICSTFSAAFVGYGLARFKFKGNGVVFSLVVVTMLIPLQTIFLPLYTTFKFFDIFGIFSLLGSEGISLVDTPFPMLLLAITCLGFRAGIYVILMRQYYAGIPKELIEAAYVDGSSVMKTFWEIVLPMAKSMLIVVFSLSFAWQWSDTFYSGILNGGTDLLPRIVILMTTYDSQVANAYELSIKANTAAIVAVIPLLIFYCILQKRIIQGIENSGIVG